MGTPPGDGEVNDEEGGAGAVGSEGGGASRTCLYEVSGSLDGAGEVVLRLGKLDASNCGGEWTMKGRGQGEQFRGPCLECAVEWRRLIRGIFARSCSRICCWIIWEPLSVGCSPSFL